MIHDTGKKVKCIHVSVALLISTNENTILQHYISFLHNETKWLNACTECAVHYVIIIIIIIVR